MLQNPFLSSSQAVDAVSVDLVEYAVEIDLEVMAGYLFLFAETMLNLKLEPRAPRLRKYINRPRCHAGQAPTHLGDA